MNTPARLVRIDEHAGVARLTLSHPRINALSPEFVAAMGAALGELAAREDLWVVHLCSDQRVFGAGGDLKFMRGLMQSPAPGATMRGYVADIQRVLRQIETLPAITVCELAGAAYGGGLETALACDFRVAADTVEVGLPEVGLGLLPAAGGTQRLTRLVGAAFARQVIMLDQRLDAASALRIGLVDAVFPAAACAAGTAQFIDRLRGKPRESLLAAKACIAHAVERAPGGAELEVRCAGELIETAETRKRVNEYLDASAARHK